jgi:hypothetical protein
MKRLVLSILIIVCFLIAKNEAFCSQVIITYDWSRIPTHGSNQIAIWVEDLSGKYVRTLFATKFTAKGGYLKRPLALGEWAAKFDLPNASAGKVDAITGATPQTGKQTVSWDCTDEKGENVPDGIYIIRMEANIQDAKKMYFRGEIGVGGNDQQVSGEITYSTSELADGNILFKDVSIEYRSSGKIPQSRVLCNLDPSEEAIALYRYLLDMSGKKILSGQMNSAWGIDEFEYLQSKTGKQPAIKGLDFIHQKDNEGEIRQAIDWWKTGGIPTIMWHWGAPGIGEGYENSKKEIAIDQCFVEGSAENNAFWTELKTKADLLEKTRDALVPILWRPYHELNGNWFWWGKQGPERFKKLWITMYNYFVNERKLNNLIWVLCFTGEPDGAWYPGDQYVDIAGADTYDGGDDPHQVMYSKLKDIVKDSRMPVAYHECGVPPDPGKCLSQGIMWSWWMEWHTTWLTKVDVSRLNEVYHHDLVITLDEVPDIMSDYGKKSVY